MSERGAARAQSSNNPFNWRRARWIVASVAAMLTLTVGVAYATGVTLKSKTVTLPNDADPHSASAKCPLGTHAAGGGVKLSDKASDYIQGSHPSSTNKRLW